MKNLKNIFIPFLCISLFASAQKKEATQEFYFGNKVKAKSGIVINASNVYSDAIGYGFDLESASNVVLNDKALIGEKPVYFSIKLPEGNYKVEVVLGGQKAANSTVKAESRRLMLGEIKTKANETVTQSFVVNVRTPKINNKRNIKLKKRELDYLNWDNKLTLEFLGNPMIQSIKITAADGVKTLYICGDSTVTDQNNEPWGSWGQFIPNFFTSDLAVANYAESGESLSSSKGAYRLDKVLSVIKKGDYFIIEFGHNDEKRKGEGAGAWNLYSDLLKEYVTRAREKGGIPILVTPTERRRFNTDGSQNPTHGEFPDAMRKIATDMNVLLIDVTKMTNDMYGSWGDEASKKAFAFYPANTFPGQTEALADNTHFNSFGANEVAKCVVQGIKDLKLDIAKFIRPTVSNYDPKKPASFNDWSVPMSNRFEVAKPDGN